MDNLSHYNDSSVVAFTKNCAFIIPLISFWGLRKNSFIISNKLNKFLFYFDVISMTKFLERMQVQ